MKGQTKMLLAGLVVAVFGYGVGALGYDYVTQRDFGPSPVRIGLELSQTFVEAQQESGTPYHSIRAAQYGAVRDVAGYFRDSGFQVTELFTRNELPVLEIVDPISGGSGLGAAQQFIDNEFQSFAYAPLNVLSVDVIEVESPSLSRWQIASLSCLLFVFIFGLVVAFRRASSALHSGG